MFTIFTVLVNALICCLLGVNNIIRVNLLVTTNDCINFMQIHFIIFVSFWIIH